MFGPDEIDERFADGLDETVWTPAYLPAWSSRTAAAATYRVRQDGLHLSIPPDQPLWCPDLHQPPLRVSAVQSGNWSGPVGSSRGQQPFREGLAVTEAQPTRWGFTPHYGYVEVTCRADLRPGAMFSAWLVGLEDQPMRCGEICLVEIFGNSDDGSGQVALGRGIHPFRDPRLVEDFWAEPGALVVGELHSYAVDWQPDRVDFLVDGVVTRSVLQAPDYPMQLIIAVFDFPAENADSPGPLSVPELVVTGVRGRRRSP
jgi:Glycosyl hydrolases family 16